MLKRILASLVVAAGVSVPAATIAVPAASATSPQVCENNAIDRTIYCYQIVGVGTTVDFFHGSLHNYGNVCVNTIMVAVRGQWNLWSRIYTVRPGQFVYWYFDVWRNLPSGAYTASFWDISWGTVFNMTLWVHR